MKEVGLEDVFKNIEGALDKRDVKEAEKWLWPALDQFADNPQLHFYASHIYVALSRYSSAYLHAKLSMELAPNGHAATNIGAIARRMNDLPGAIRWLYRALDYDSQNKHAWNNLASAYCNEGNPWPGIEAAKRAIALDPSFQKARWNMGLMKLEAGDFETGWDDYRDGLTEGERMLRFYGKLPTDPPTMLESRAELRNYMKQHGKKPRLAIWGEQGIGDEIMFSTVLREVAEEAEVVFECHPRLISIFELSYPEVAEFHPTRKDDRITWPKDVPPIDYKCSMGELGRLWRRSRESFVQGPFLKADEALTQRYRATLDELATLRGQPNALRVGFAYTGGTIHTMRWYRSINPMILAPILTHQDIMPVSLQYEDEGPTVAAFHQKHGKPYLAFPAVTQHYDYMHTAALVAALDVVITVCQSVAHLSAAMGKRTYVLTPDKPAWRYGIGPGEDWYWYGQEDRVKLLRMEKGDWSKPLARLTELLGL